MKPKKTLIVFKLKPLGRLSKDFGKRAVKVKINANERKISEIKQRHRKSKKSVGNQKKHWKPKISIGNQRKAWEI